MADQVQEPIQNHKAPADHLLKNVDLGPPQQPQKKVRFVLQVQSAKSAFTISTNTLVNTCQEYPSRYKQHV